VEAGREFPDELLYLETAQGLVKPFKTDYLARKIWFSAGNTGIEKTWLLTLDEVRQFIQDNKRGLKPDLETKKPQQSAESQFISGSSDIKSPPPSRNRKKARKITAR
jgi:hypothetical protein